APRRAPNGRERFRSVLTTIQPALARRRLLPVRLLSSGGSSSATFNRTGGPKVWFQTSRNGNREGVRSQESGVRSQESGAACGEPCYAGRAPRLIPEASLSPGSQEWAS